MSLPILLFLARASALSVFHPNCSLPETSVTYVSAPTTRGSLDIVWNSIAVFIACTYTIIHLNVPKQPGPEDEKLNFGHKIASWATRYPVALIWATFAPEMVLSKAVVDWRSARAELKRLQGAFPEAGWTLTHMFYADMGGFVIRYNVQIQEPPRSMSPGDRKSTTAQRGDSFTTGPGLEGAQNYGLQSSDVQDSQSRSKEFTDPPGDDTIQMSILRHINARLLCDAILNGDLDPECPVAETDILDRSKGDSFAKAFSTVQLLFFFAVILNRAAQRQLVTQLELSVTTFAICSIVSFGFLIGKPKAVETAVDITQVDIPPQQSIASAKDVVKHLAAEMMRNEENLAFYVGEPMPFWAIHQVKYFRSYYLVFSVAGSLMGAIHVAGWNLSFPSQADAWIWRSSALAVTSTSVLYGLHAVFTILTTGNRFNGESPLHRPFVSILFQIYFWGRVLLFVETIRCLFYLPPDAYKVAGWAASLPHIG